MSFVGKRGIRARLIPLKSPVASRGRGFRCLGFWIYFLFFSLPFVHILWLVAGTVSLYVNFIRWAHVTSIRESVLGVMP